MKIVDELLLSVMRLPGRCEVCQQWSAVRQPHHVFARGQRSVNRLDIRINLISLDPLCHAKAHSGQITRAELFAIVARREKMLAYDLQVELYRLLREPNR